MKRHSDRIFDKNVKQVIHGASRRVGKGQKKKTRRKMRAFMQDGYERKQANGLRPQMHTSKTELREAENER